LPTHHYSIANRVRTEECRMHCVKDEKQGGRASHGISVLNPSPTCLLVAQLSFIL
jgi:hypothetical protein